MSGPEPRFTAGDLVRVRGGAPGQAIWKATWLVERRDYWHTDREPAYKLRHGAGPSLHIRYAFESDLEPAEATAERAA